MRNKRGIVFVIACIVLSVLLVFSGSLLYKIIYTQNLSKRTEAQIRAFIIAESALDFGINLLKNHAITFPYTLSNQSLDEGYFDLVIEKISPERVKITSTGKILLSTFGETNQIEKQVQAYLEEESFCRYLYFTTDEHLWGLVPVWFITGDHLRGPLHTNTHYHISGDPIFDGLAKSHDNWVEYLHGGPPLDNPQFNGGLLLGVPTIDLPTDASSIKTAALSGGLYLKGKTLVVFNNDGTLTITNNNKGWYQKVVSPPSNRVIYIEDGNVYVRGVVKGNFTVGTNKNIIITDNIVYAEDPRTTPTSTDMLGLVAEQNVIVSTDDDDGSQIYDQACPYDLEIDASIMALGDSFVVENWWSCSPLGTLTLFGGVIQKYRGPVGTFDPITNQKLSGYTKDYQYDERFESSHPPYFPTTGDWRLLAWEEVE